MIPRTTLRLFQTVSKNVWLAPQISAFYGIGPVTKRFFSDKIQFDRITSYDNLNQRIHNSSSIEEALSILSNSSAVLRVEHAAVGLRAIGRYVRTPRYGQTQGLEFLEDETFKSTVEKVRANIDSLTEISTNEQNN